MALYDDLASFVDQRIAASREGRIAMGTVVSSTSTSIYCNVVFDGSSASVPVKTFGNVVPETGDRVGLVKFGSDWTVVGTFGNNGGMKKVYNKWDFQGVGSTSSTTFVSMAVNPFTYIKQYDDTQTLYMMSVGCFTDTVGAEAWFNIQMDSTVPADFPIFLFFNVANTHLTASGTWLRSGEAKGTHSMQAVWLRFAGAGLLKTDNGDSITMTAIEVAP